MAFSEAVKDQIYRQAGGRCQCNRMSCHGSGGRCTAKLGRNQGQFHHLRSLLSGGPDTAANGQHLCVKCHQNTASYGG